MARKASTTTNKNRTTTKATTKATKPESATAKDIVKAANEEVNEIPTQDEVVDEVEPKDINKDVSEPIEKAADIVQQHEKARIEKAQIAQPSPPTQKVYDQHELILCRNVSAGWLKMTGKSGIPYVWNATGDVCEVEYGDLWARKTAKSEYLYKPYFVIEDEELLEQPRWRDLKAFYEDKVYGLDNVDAIINVPSSSIRKVLTALSDGMRNAVAVRASVMIEEGSLDSLKKIKIIDEVCGTDLMSVIPD